MKTLTNRAETDAGILERKRKMKKMATLLLVRKYAVDSLYYWKTSKCIEASNAILVVSWVWEMAFNLSGTGSRFVYPFGVCWSNYCVCGHAQSCLTLFNPMDCSPPGSLCPWDFRILEWVATCYSRGSSFLVSPALAGRFFTTVPPGKPSIKWWS